MLIAVQNIRVSLDFYFTFFSQLSALRLELKVLLSLNIG